MVDAQRHGRNDHERDTPRIGSAANKADFLYELEDHTLSFAGRQGDHQGGASGVESAARTAARCPGLR